MPQHDIPNLLQTDPDGPDLAALLDNFFLAQKSGHSGASRPGYALEGLVWSKIDGATKKAFFYDGAADRELAQLNDVVAKSGGTMTGALTLPAGGLNVGAGQLQVDALGRVLTPNRPAFQAYGHNNNVQATSGENNANLVYTTLNVGSHYSTTTLKFTAPVDGLYYFNFNVYWQGTTNYSRQLIRKNGSINLAYAIEPAAEPAHTASVSCVVNLAAGDFIEPRVQSDGGDNFFGGLAHTYLEGCLLG